MPTCLSMERLQLYNRQPDPVLVVGSVAYDNIITPHQKGSQILGGSASYASLAASYFAPTRICGVVGNDFRDSDIQRLQDHQIDIAGLQIDTSGPTFTWSGRYHENFNHRETLDIQLNVFEYFRPVIPEEAQSSPFLMLGNIQPGLQLHVLQQMTGQPFVLADTIDLWIQVERDGLVEVIRKVDLLAINDSEASLLTGKSNLFDAGDALLAEGPAYVIIKKGSHGCILFSSEGLFALPAYPVRDLQDPTGAGDSFAGALLGYLATRGETSESAIREGLLFATAAASLTVEAFSCDRLESAGGEAIEERARELRSMISL